MYPGPMGKAVHVLSNIQIEARRAVCAGCGPVDLVFKSGRPICPVARRERRGPVDYDGFRTSPRTGEGRHGLTRTEAASLVEGKSCEICGAPAIAADHNHQTGEIRGPLCRGCNLGLGQFEDEPDRLRAAADYLERHR